MMLPIVLKIASQAFQKFSKEVSWKFVLCYLTYMCVPDSVQTTWKGLKLLIMAFVVKMTAMYVTEMKNAGFSTLLVYSLAFS